MMACSSILFEDKLTLTSLRPCRDFLTPELTHGEIHDKPSLRRI